MTQQYSEHTPPQLPVTVKWRESGKDWSSLIETPTEWFNFVWRHKRLESYRSTNYCNKYPFTVEGA
jgi:hypothetical protein